MPFIDLVDDQIVIHSEYQERDRVKQVPGVRWDKDQRTWKVAVSWGACITLRGVFGASLEVGETLAAWAWQERERRVDPALSLRYELEFPGLLQQEPELYPFQRVGVRFLEIAQRALLADEMGTGKTIQLIRTIHRLNALPALIVCPNSMKYTWQREFARWAPSIPTVVIDGTAAKRRKQLADEEALVVIINWEALRLHSRLAPYGSIALSDKEKEPKELNEVEWQAVVADEAHRAKDAAAKQTRALKAIAVEAPYRFAATGTPIANHPGELWSVMNFVAPEDFPRKTAYVDRYCQLSWNAFGGMDIVGLRPDTQPELEQFLLPRVIRRLKEVVLPQLPAKLPPQVRYTPMSTKQQKAYDQVADQMLAELDSGILIASTALARMTRLSQFASSYATITEAGEVKLASPSNKLDALDDLVEEAEGQPLVVFAMSRQLIELAEDRLRKRKVAFGSIHGNVDLPTRQESVEAFQQGRLQVILATTGAGGEGLTLTAANVVVFLQRPWSLIESKQAVDRLHRPGQEREVQVIDLVAPGTVEEYRLERLAAKEDRLQEVVQDEQTLREMLRYRG